MALTPEEIERRFGYHPADTPERVAAHEEVRAACRDLALLFDGRLPKGREKALALTLCEQAMFWANAAVARESREKS
ncbi:MULTISPECIES: DUF7681 family protein [unclassified Streptomyces]|uniref:Acb2/Tad1 domain-containing protein n=1 Tax=unclassified Streptomyces TaxID=2593676 RepID=UPI000A94B0A2|nr:MULTISPECIES: hypothetical protein [unclassified Streptomyces]